MRQWHYLLFCCLLLSPARGFLVPSRPNPRLPKSIQKAASKEDDTSLSLKDQYAKAREVRTLLGHEAACPLYQEILRANPGDRTAATRLAASPLTNKRHDQTCSVEANNAILEARDLLTRCNYSHDSVARFFGQEGTNQELRCQGPLFVSPVQAGSVSTSNYPLSGNSPPLAYLIGLFLLSLAVPVEWLEQAFGKTSIQWMQELGWAFPCSNDPSLMVPYVHVFPMDFCSQQSGVTTLWFVTDLHPRVLSTTSVGNTGTGNAVMYIGPDSLALPQHFHPYLLDESPDSKIDTATMGILDLGTGSGVQALSAIQISKMDSDNNQRVHAVAVDINPRALLFAKFNANLNGLEDHLTLVHADLVSGLCKDDDSQLEKRLDQYQVHLILANPPFLPVPSDTRKDEDIEASNAKADSYLKSIDRRYGLFSSGGASGELLLKRILEIASRNLEVGGYLGIVSEFFLLSQDPNFERFCNWWETRTDTVLYPANGILFLNEYPIDTDTYASRRADNPSEKEIWVQHLSSLNIAFASPGLLYVRKEKSDSSHKSSMDLAISLVPKTKMGSIWTPSNRDAIAFAKATASKRFGWKLR